MKIDEDALKNFQASKFDFVYDSGKEPDYSNLNADGQYVLRIGETVVQDQMKADDVVKTINNEFGKKTNV